MVVGRIVVGIIAVASAFDRLVEVACFPPNSWHARTLSLSSAAVGSNPSYCCSLKYCLLLSVAPSAIVLSYSLSTSSCCAFIPEPTFPAVLVMNFLIHTLSAQNVLNTRND